MTYEDHHAALVQYLKVKVEQADWHGVSDAANDLRVLEAQHDSRKTTRDSQSGWQSPEAGATLLQSEPAVGS